jgi:hypothetical protein
MSVGPERYCMGVEPENSSFEDEVGHLNTAYFFREFTFSSNTFKPDPKAELELADKVVWLDDFLIVSQVKERKAPPDTDAENERRWFSDQVARKATRQIRDTLSYLKTYSQIEVRNERGHIFNVARAQVKQIHKLVIYNPHKLLPKECAFKKHHRSRTAGVIHLMHSAAYLGVLHTLVTPVEIADYLTFREALVTEWEDASSEVSERALVGQYLRNLPEEKPCVQFVKYVDEVEQKGKDWDISRIIHLFPERKTTKNPPETDYTVIKELAKLYRTEMAEFKKRFQFSMQKAVADEFCLPHRFTTSKRCGYVFVPLQRADAHNKRKALVAFTELNKYDQKLDKCVGLSFEAEGEGSWCDVQWCPIEFPWKEDAVLQSLLEKNYPFRPVRTRKTERYGLSDAPIME